MGLAKSPAGTPENSPAIHRWDRVKQPMQAPQGRKKSFQIALHIIHTVFLEKRFDLFLERHGPVVLRLVIDVLRRVFDAGDADAESSVTFLPLKVSVLFKRVVN